MADEHDTAARANGNHASHVDVILDMRAAMHRMATSVLELHEGQCRILRELGEARGGQAEIRAEVRTLRRETREGRRKLDSITEEAEDTGRHDVLELEVGRLREQRDEARSALDRQEARAHETSTWWRRYGVQTMVAVLTLAVGVVVTHLVTRALGSAQASTPSMASPAPGH